MAKTIHKYMRTIHRVTRFIWRMDVMVQSASGGDVRGEEKGDVPAFTLTAIQQRYLSRIKSITRVSGDQGEDGGDGAECSKRLEDAIVQFWIFTSYTLQHLTG